MGSLEKRKHIRFDAVNPSEISIFNDNIVAREGRGKTINISQGGTLIETPFPIEKGQKLSLIINLGDEVVYISGQVAHSREEAPGTHRTGVEFFSIDETGQSILQKYITICSQDQKSQKTF